MKNNRLYMKLLAKPEPVAPKPVYARVPLFLPPPTDNRKAWRDRMDALESERNRAQAQALSANHRAPQGAKP